MSVTSCTAANEIGKRGRGRPKTQGDSQRREAIIDTARNTFIELGYQGTTTDIVAQRCQISKQTLYRLFPSKAELFVAIVANHRQFMLELPRRRARPSTGRMVSQQCLRRYSWSISATSANGNVMRSSIS